MSQMVSPGLCGPGPQEPELLRVLWQQLHHVAAVDRVTPFGYV